MHGQVSYNPEDALSQLLLAGMLYMTAGPHLVM